jgi:hypothetical protein
LARNRSGSSEDVTKPDDDMSTSNFRPGDMERNQHAHAQDFDGNSGGGAGGAWALGLCQHCT